MLSNKHHDAFLALLQQCFSSRVIDKSEVLIELQAELKNAYAAFDIELRSNLLNAKAIAPRVLLENSYADLEQFSSLMIRDSLIVDNLFAAKGWEIAGIIDDNPVWSDARLDEAEADDKSGRSLLRIQEWLNMNQSVESLFSTLTPIEIQTVRKGLASTFVKKAWERLNRLYGQHGGIARDVPRKGNKFLVVSQPILQDLRCYVPGMRELSAFACPTEAHAFEEWAKYLNNLRWWNYPFSQPWPAPIDFEQAFHEAADRNAFLSGLRRLLDSIEPHLAVPDEDNQLFREENQVFSVEQREQMRRHSLYRARVNAKRMGQWLQLRQKPAGEQLMQALERILLVPEWTDRGEPTNRLTVAYQHTEHDVTLHFRMLLARFQEEIPQTPYSLNALNGRLTQFLNTPFEKLTGVGFGKALNLYTFSELNAALITWLPHLHFVDGVKYLTEIPVNQIADNFWEALTENIISRKPWAQMALTLVQAALGTVKSKREVSFLLDAYINPGFTRQEIDAFLFKQGLIEGDAGMLVANAAYKPGAWAAVRYALHKHKIISSMSNGVAAKVFDNTYKVSVSKDTFNYKPASQNQRNMWSRNDEFYYELLASVVSEFTR